MTATWLDILKDCIAKGDLVRLIAVCEDMELESTISPVAFSSATPASAAPTLSNTPSPTKKKSESHMKTTPSPVDQAPSTSSTTPSSSSSPPTTNTAGGSASSVVLDPVVYSCLLAGYLATNDLSAARFLCKRAPAYVIITPEFRALHAAMSALWIRDYPSCYTALLGPAAQQQTTQQPPSPSKASAQPMRQQPQWSPLLAPLIARVGEAIRERTFRLIARAYETITPNDASLFLGVSQDQVVNICISKGWKLDSESGCLLPSKPGAAEAMDVARPAEAPGLAQLGDLTSYIIHLERS